MIIEDLLLPFQEGTKKTFLELCKTEVHSIKLLEKGKLPPNLTSVAGMIGITSPSIEGSVSIQFSEKTFLKVVNQMLGGHYTELSHEIDDGAAEFTNIIFGYAKNELNQKGMGIQMALPSLLTGKSIHYAGSGGSQSVQTIAYLTELGPFYHVIHINQKKEDVQPPHSKAPFNKNWGAEVLLEFVKASRKTLEIQFGTQIEVGSPFLKSANSLFSFDV